MNGGFSPLEGFMGKEDYERCAFMELLACCRQERVG